MTTSIDCWFGTDLVCQGPGGDPLHMCEACELELKEQHERATWPPPAHDTQPCPAPEVTT